MVILGIETSCDETSVSVVEAKGGLSRPSFKILSNAVSSQIKTHAKWGGVVPSLAKREHSKNLIPIFKEALKKSDFFKSKGKRQKAKLQFKSQKETKIKKILDREPELLEQFLKFLPTVESPKIDAIAVTVGPGLEPALWAGINFAKALSLVWHKPVIAVNHMEGHVVASMLATTGNFDVRRRSTSTSDIDIKFPAVALLVSGGHTELIFIKKWLDYKIIGKTKDDAAGECFDKAARMLGLPYPGGPAISAEAAKFSAAQITNDLKIQLPRPMINSGDYDFSFSGLKTAVLYLLKDLEKKIPKKSDRLKLVPFICKEIQQAIIDVLIAKTLRAAKEFKAKSIILGGGVAANKELRRQMKKAFTRESADRWRMALFLPAPELTTDNAAMIAAAGYFHALKQEFINPDKLKAKGNLEF